VRDCEMDETERIRWKNIIQRSISVYCVSIARGIGKFQYSDCRIPVS